MGTTPIRLGDPLHEEAIVYRAFALHGYRQRKPPKVRPFAYYRDESHIDGLSLGETPESAVAGLEINYGYCSIRVGDIRALRQGLDVRPDLDNPGHLILCNVPILTGSDEERGRAAQIAGQLARISKPICFDHYPPSQAEDLLPSIP
jgi:hypothetical protein